MTDERSSAEIEREIEEERHALARSLEDLQAQFSPERIMNQATGYLRSNGGDLAENLMRQVKQNPLAAAMAGVGVAWLLTTSNRPPKAPSYDRARFTHDTRHGDGTDRSASNYDADLDDRPYGSTTASTGTATYDDRAYPSAPGRLSSPYAGGFEGRVEGAAETRSDDGPSAGERLREGYEGARAGAADRWGSMREGTSSRFREWQAGASGRADEARMRAGAARDRLYMRSQELRGRISEGTEEMSEQARMRVMRARQAAADAQETLEARFGEAKASGARMYDEQPLVAGAIALAVGAAIGASLPRTEVEDEYLGSHRDRLFDEADSVFREEASKLRAVADAALDEARSVADEKMEAAKGSTPSGRDAVDKAETEVRSAAQRVADRARDEAEKQGLGQATKDEAEKAAAKADEETKRAHG